MKLFKLLVFLILLISPANANTIFYLIKIPNLELYKTSEINQIKYLKASKAFQVGIRDNNVSCSKAYQSSINEKFNGIKNQLDRYSKNFLKKINFKYVVLCRDLYVSDIPAAGVPNHKYKTVIINLDLNAYLLERTLHHEIFHIINDSYQNLFNENIWKKFNEQNFNYAKCSTCSEKLNLELYKKTNGFLTEYSKSTPSEDMAETFSFLMTDLKKIEKIILNDKVLFKKVEFIKNNIFKIEQNFIF
tara:strand:+ start:96 stop:833 length:738 start_codon:yes stop_codon:yes gene_type:complete